LLGTGVCCKFAESKIERLAAAYPTAAAESMRRRMLASLAEAVVAILASKDLSGSFLL